MAAIGPEVGRLIMPMLAPSAPDDAVVTDLSPGGTTEVAIDAKLDGIRIQVHRDGDDLLVATRSLHDITSPASQLEQIAETDGA